MTEVEQPPPQNGIDLSAAEDDDSSKARPADIEQDMREMERRKRVEAIMSSKLFREELERIVDSARDGGGILQQLSDIMGVPSSTRVGSVFKATNCMLPINDIRGVESMGYAKGEKILRCKLAATFRLLDLYGWTQGLGAQITARLKVDQENFLVNPYGMMYHEITASSLNKVDMQGQVIEQGTTNFGVNKSHFAIHSVVHAARPDIRCAIYIGCSPVVAVSSLKVGLLPLTRDACVLGEVTTHQYTGALADAEERDKLVRALGPVSKVLILSNYGALCCGETIEEAFFAASHIVQACETQLKLLPVGVDNLVLIPEESRKIIYEQSRRPPEDLEKKFAAVVSTVEGGAAVEEAGAKDGTVIKATGNVPKWRVGGAEFEALMRMLDNAGYRTGYIYRHPLIKSDPPKPKNDVELPPAVSSLGYLLEEEEMLRQGIWKKGDLRKGGDRSKWLNSPNVYQKVEVLETGTPDPKKITKWVAEGSPTHSTPVRIEDPLQFVPAGTNPKEFKRLQQQIKDNRRADKISAGPQSHILEGVTWDEANRIKDATVSSAGDHVVLMGAASKGIIQRGFQHNAAVYKAPYAKNPFDNVTDDELNEYKRTVERKKKSIHGEYTDTDFSESEPLSSLQTSGAQQQTKQTTITTAAAVSQSEPEDVSEHQVMRIETQQAPVPSQPEVVLSDDLEDDGDDESEEDQAHRRTVHRRRSVNTGNKCAVTATAIIINQFQTNTTAVHHQQQHEHKHHLQTINKEILFRDDQSIKRNTALIAELKNDLLFQRQKQKLHPTSSTSSTVPITTTSNNNNSHDKNNNNNYPLNTNNNTCNFNFNPNNLRCNNLNRNLHSDGESFGGGGALHTQTHTHAHTPINHANANAHAHNSHYHIHTYNHCHSDCDIYCRVHSCNSNELVPRHAYSFPDTHIHNSNIGQNCAHHPSHICITTTTNSNDIYAEPLPTFEQAFTSHQSADAYCTLLYDPYAQYCEPVYDKPSQFPEENNKAIAPVDAVTTTAEESENPYKKSSLCCTPAVCESIFEVLRKPTPLDNNLIFNIPFTAQSPETTVTSGTSPRKARSDLQHKSAAAAAQNATSPYRTTSHFGFNSPQREPQPEHKHLPTPFEPKKYVPLRKSISYEEIFSSPRYVDLCENCFEKIVRLKPEVVQSRTRLRNIVDCCGGTGGNRSSGGSCICGMYQSTNEYCTAAGNNAYDYVEYASSDTTETLPPFSSQLEPVLEVEEVEPDSADDVPKAIKPPLPPALEHSVSNSSFIDKIMRLNYSEESTNINYNEVAQTACSNITMELERAILEGYVSMHKPRGPGEVPHYNTEVELETSNNEVNEQSLPQPQPQPHGNVEGKGSIVEVWEFIHWQNDQQQECSDLAGAFSGPANATELQDDMAESKTESKSQRSNVCLYYDKAHDEIRSDRVAQGESTKNNDDQQNNIGNNGRENSGDVERQPKHCRRSLMSREERSRRKLVFQELWEDHIFFLDGKEQNMLSDTESAIDSQQPQEDINIVDVQFAEEGVEAVADEVEAPACLDVQQSLATVDASCHVDVGDTIVAEVFASRSYILKKHSHTPIDSECCDASADVTEIPTTFVLDGTATAEIRDEKAAESDGACSTRTYSVHTSQENLFFRDHRLAKTPADAALCGMDNETVKMDVAPVGHNMTLAKQNQNWAEVIGEMCKRRTDITFMQDENHDAANDEDVDADKPKELVMHVGLPSADDFDEVERLRIAKNTENSSAPSSCNDPEPRKLPYAPSVEEYELYKQNVEVNSEAEGEICSDENQFAELVESESHLDLTKLSEEFEEILLHVENLQCDIRNIDEMPVTLSEEDTENAAFDPVERKILRKIKEHHLNESEEIFDKIETAIRNKLTPSKMELLVMKQKLASNAADISVVPLGDTFTTSTPDKASIPIGMTECRLTDVTVNISKISTKCELHDSASLANYADDESSTLTPKNQRPYSPNNSTTDDTDAKNERARHTKRRTQQRRSRSQTPYRNSGGHSPSSQKLNKTTTPPVLQPRKSQSADNVVGARDSDAGSGRGRSNTSHNNWVLQTYSTPDIKQVRASGSKRNFILENIRNAALPRGSIKRLQGNAQAIFCKNPFGPVGGQGAAKTLQLPACSNSTSCSSLSQKLSPRNSDNISANVSNNNTSNNPPVFTFQSKLVRGSPRFWVSLSQTTPKKLQSSKIMQKRRKRHHHHSRGHIDLHDSTGSLDEPVPMKEKGPSGLLVAAAAVTTATANAAITAAAAGIEAIGIGGGGGVECEIEALGEQIQQLHPRLETYKRTLHDYGEHVATCSRHMDECIVVQGDIAVEQRQLHEEIILNQYAEQITCQVQTYSISEAED